MRRPLTGRAGDVTTLKSLRRRLPTQRLTREPGPSALVVTVFLNLAPHYSRTGSNQARAQYVSCAPLASSPLIKHYNITISQYHNDNRIHRVRAICMSKRIARTNSKQASSNRLNRATHGYFLHYQDYPAVRLNTKRITASLPSYPAMVTAVRGRWSWMGLRRWTRQRTVCFHRCQ